VLPFAIALMFGRLIGMGLSSGTGPTPLA
jgi:hypothetical protein